jgi:hypothetical protein
MKSLTIILLTGLFLTACGGSAVSKVDDSKWTAQDKENATKSCKFGRQKDDPAKVEKLCACYLNKVIALSPNPAEQSKIPMAEVTKLNAECAKEAGL